MCSWRFPGVMAWSLLVLLLQAACATSLSQGRPVLSQPEDERVRLTLAPRFGAVPVSDRELDEALAALVLHLPLRVVGATSPRSLARRLVWVSASLTDEVGRTPLSRAYGHFCERQGAPGDCLELFQDGPGLDGEDKRDLALALSVDAALESRDAELRGLFSTTRLSTTLSITLAGYLALIAAPEPVSKGIAAAFSLLLWGYLGWELLDLVSAWFALWEEAAQASTFAELREAGERFGRVLGPNSVRVLLLLGTAAMAPQASALPGLTRAAAALESQAGIQDVWAASRAADLVRISVAEGTFSVVLPTQVLSMTASRGAAPGADPVKKKPEVHHIATVENSKSTARGGPWTQRFKSLFDKAKVSMEDPANKVQLAGHQGPHPEGYHQEVYRRLREATSTCQGALDCRGALITELRRMARELIDTNSSLYRLLREGAPR